MNNRNPNLREKYLDGEILFRKYFEMGDAKSIGRLTKYAISQGMTSSTGQEPTQMGVWKSMWRWASLKENRDTAWKIYKQFNPSHTSEYWKRMMLVTVCTAWQFPTFSKYYNFLKSNDWLFLSGYSQDDIYKAIHHYYHRNSGEEMNSTDLEILFGHEMYA